MRKFLTAEWRHLLMINYAVDPKLLLPHIPNGVELDTWNAKTYVSMVGFLFLRTRVMGLRIPLHSNFEEVNLRFYVRKRSPEGWRRGVVFLKEIVPRALIATVARIGYNEPYATMPMRHRIEIDNEGASLVEYSWRFNGRWNSLSGKTAGAPCRAREGSEEEFITEHYWGYTAQSDGRCKEYQVEHARWLIWRAENVALNCDVASICGAKFVQPLNSPPRSAFIADGSPVTVGSGEFL